ncbi:DUF1800 domain-containing protein [Chitinophaga horti]|uniref:DUF1800 domain-containing protein n=1 Tax=Chitinophaga horti TaxID=2920382 RepID=A0ABY6J1G0_9BACT|nr:DUF1800 domain-containing protein [Chitinophaga horti]UYQ92049.1 DUF1800 domain-containing protein [Chitinophaga horti]
MDRRSFLALAPSRNKKAPVKAARTLSGLAPYTGPWNTAQVVHLLKRAMFGAAVPDVNYFKGLGMDAAVDALLNFADTTPAPPINNYQNDEADPEIAAGASWVMSAPIADNDDLENARRQSFKAWWLGLMVNQPRSMREKMTLFWHNHFATEAVTIKDARYVYNHNTVLRQHALGNFKALTKAVTLEPGMLVYLNGYLNEKTAADENYARELLELFTCGKGEMSQYTEEDVRAAARVLTGYRINPTTITSFFDATKHDITNKEFSAFLFNRVISGRTGPDGTKELDELLNVIFQQEEVAKYLCRRFYRFFVYYEIDDATETNVITPLAQIFRTNNYEIKPLLSALFKSEHFYDPLNMSCLIKSPIDFSVGLCREFGVQFPSVTTDYMAAYGAWSIVQQAAANQQQNIGDPPLVSGWEAYFQEPQFHELWINTDTYPKRNMYSDQMITSGISRSGGTIVIDPMAFAEMLSAPEDPIQLRDESLSILHRMDVSAEVKEALRKILLSDQDMDYYWTTAWNAYMADKSNMMAREVVHGRLQSFYKYIMDLSEYQLS